MQPNPPHILIAVHDAVDDSFVERCLRALGAVEADDVSRSEAPVVEVVLNAVGVAPEKKPRAVIVVSDLGEARAIRDRLRGEMNAGERIEIQGPRSDATNEEPILAWNGWTYDEEERSLRSPDDEELVLTHYEATLLSLFLNRRGDVLTREYLLRKVAGRIWSPEDRSIDVLVGRLRKKIERRPRKPEMIITVRGVGYRWATPVERRAKPRYTRPVNPIAWLSPVN